MSVLVRPKRNESIRRRRQGFRPEPSAAPSGARAAAPPPEPATPRSHVTAEREHRRAQDACAGQPLTNDQAVYSCACGYVFQAPVSTSVDCPHCGGTQAW